MKHHQGFTLVELILVIVVLGIISVSIGPRFFGNNQFSNRYYFDDLYSAISFAHHKATTGGCLVQVSLTANSYNLTTDSECTTNNAANLNLQVMHPGDLNPFTNQTDDIVQTVNVNPFIFTPIGQVTNTTGVVVSQINLSITEGGGLVRSLTIEGQTGFMY